MQKCSHCPLRVWHFIHSPFSVMEMGVWDVDEFKQCHCVLRDNIKKYTTTGMHSARFKSQSQSFYIFIIFVFGNPSENSPFWIPSEMFISVLCIRRLVFCDEGSPVEIQFFTYSVVAETLALSQMWSDLDQCASTLW